jgi:putative transposase
MAIKAVKERGICIRVACQAFRISESCYRYERKLDAENEEVATWLIKLTDNNRNWGFGLCYLYLRNLKGFKWNHKRVYRVYKELELNLRIKPSQTVDSREARGFNCAPCNQSSLVNGLYA